MVNTNFMDIADAEIELKLEMSQEEAMEADSIAELPMEIASASALTEIYVEIIRPREYDVISCNIEPNTKIDADSLEPLDSGQEVSSAEQWLPEKQNSASLSSLYPSRSDLADVNIVKVEPPDPPKKDVDGSNANNSDALGAQFSEHIANNAKVPLREPGFVKLLFTPGKKLRLLSNSKRHLSSRFKNFSARNEPSSQLDSSCKVNNVQQLTSLQKFNPCEPPKPASEHFGQISGRHDTGYIKSQSCHKRRKRLPTKNGDRLFEEASDKGSAENREPGKNTSFEQKPPYMGEMEPVFKNGWARDDFDILLTKELHWKDIPHVCYLCCAEKDEEVPLAPDNVLVKPPWNTELPCPNRGTCKEETGLNVTTLQMSNAIALGSSPFLASGDTVSFAMPKGNINIQQSTNSSGVVGNSLPGEDTTPQGCGFILLSVPTQQRPNQVASGTVRVSALLKPPDGDGHEMDNPGSDTTAADGCCFPRTPHCSSSGSDGNNSCNCTGRSCEKCRSPAPCSTVDCFCAVVEWCTGCLRFHGKCTACAQETLAT